MSAQEITFRIGIDLSGFQAGLARAREGLKAAIGPEALAMSNVALGAIAAAGTAILGLGVAGVKSAGAMEQNAIAFETMLGSAERAQAFLSGMEDFANRTPFELPGVIEASKKLLAFKFDAEKIIPTLTSIGDAAAGLSLGEEGIQRLTTALGQMKAKGKVSGEEMLQLAEAGVPAWRYLAEAIGTDIPTAMEKAQKGAIDADTAINAVLAGMNTDFGGLMEKQSRSLLGLWSTAKDTIGTIVREIGADITGAFDIKGKLAVGVEWLGKFADIVKTSGLSEALDQMIPPGVRIAIVMLAGAIAGAAVPALYNLAAAALSALVGLLPYIAIGAAVAGAAYLIYKAWDPLGRFFGALWDAIKAAFRIGGASISVVLKEINLGLSQFLEYALGRVADFGAGLGSVVSTIPLIGGLGKALSESSASLRTWLDGYKSSATAGLDAAKSTLLEAQGDYGRSVHYMGVFGKQVVDSVAGTVKSGISDVTGSLSSIKGAAKGAGLGIAAGLGPASTKIAGINSGLQSINDKLGLERSILDAEYDKARVGLNEETDASRLAALETKHLTGEIRLQSDVVATLQRKYDALARSKGAYAEETRKAYLALIQGETELAELKSQVPDIPLPTSIGSTAIDRLLESDVGKALIQETASSKGVDLSTAEAMASRVLTDEWAKNGYQTTTKGGVVQPIININGGDPATVKRTVLDAINLAGR